MVVCITDMAIWQHAGKVSGIGPDLAISRPSVLPSAPNTASASQVETTFAAQWLAYLSPANASPDSSRCPTRDQGSAWFATPFTVRDFTLYSLPVSRRTLGSLFHNSTGGHGGGDRDVAISSQLPTTPFRASSRVRLQLPTAFSERVS